MTAAPKLAATSDVTLTASARATQGEVAYQWQRRSVGTDWADVPGATQAVLILRGVDPLQGGEQYRVVASAAGVSATSGVATLVVRAASMVQSRVRLRLSGARLGERPVLQVRASATGSVRVAARRGNVRAVRVVTVGAGSTRKFRLPRTLTRRTGKLVVRVTLRPTARTNLPSRSTLYTVVRR